MSKILMESLKLDLPALADMIRSKGRGKDTMLAHITPKEAALLKKRGGAGTINPDTGLPEFYDDYSMDTGSFGDVGESFVAEPQQTFSEYYPSGAAPTTTFEPSYVSGYDVPGGGFYPGGEMPRATGYDVGGAYPSGTQVPAAVPGVERATLPGVVSPAAAAAPTTPKEAPKFTEQLKEYLTDPKNIARLGLTAGLGALGVRGARQGARQVEAATQEQKAIAQPYTEQGKQLLAQAQRGELTPQSQQALEAAKAQLAQATATRGGVGQQQAANQIANLYSQLLDNQYKYGLNIMNIGDQIQIGAIRSGLQLDQQMQGATRNFYMNLAQMAAGSTPGGTTIRVG